MASSRKEFTSLAKSNKLGLKPNKFLESIISEESKSPPLPSAVEQFLHAILNNMHFNTGKPLVIAGSTGIGKTTFVKDLALLLGLKIIVIEAPNVAEEELINIPFYVFSKGQKTAGNEEVDLNDVDIKMGRSYLAGALHKLQPIPDAEYLREISQAPAYIQSWFNELKDGDEPVPNEIKQIRSKYWNILFVDEYWRKTGNNVRNILRGFLNGKIGDEKLPPHTYVLYASNISDVGSTVEQIPTNAVPTVIELPPKSKNEIINWTIERAKKSGKTLSPIIINVLKKDIVKDEHTSFNDIENDIRTSPRRFTQFILYLNSSLPVDTEEKAKSLLASVKSMFSNETGKISKIHSLYERVTRDVIDQSGSEFSQVKEHGSDSWRNTLYHQLEMKLKMGDLRTYVPIISGPPGIGKTTQMVDIAHKLNLLYVAPDVQGLTSDSVIGGVIPKTKNAEGEDIKVGFAKPALLQTIENISEDAKKDFMNNKNVPQEKKEQWSKQKYKYLLFFDEFNRVKDQSTFNNLRRLILEKEFNDRVKLPEEYVVVAAMNPGDLKTFELTQHMRDAVDIIDASPHWEQQREWIESKAIADKYPILKTLPKDVIDMSRRVLFDFAMSDFTLEHGGETNIPSYSRPFYLLVGEQVIPFSPRDYTTLYGEIVQNIGRAWKKYNKNSQFNLNDLLSHEIKPAFRNALIGAMTTHGDVSKEWIEKVNEWVDEEVALITSKKSTAKPNIADMLDKVLSKEEAHLTDDDAWPNLVQNFEYSEFQIEMKAYLEKLAEQEIKKYEIWAKDQVQAKTKVAGKRTLLTGLWSKLRLIGQELKLAVKEHEVSGEILDAFNLALREALGQIEDSSPVPPELHDELMSKGVSILHDIMR
jgi:MoxR-like ATPase